MAGLEAMDERKSVRNNIKEVLTLLGIPELSLEGDLMENWKSWKEKYLLYASVTEEEGESEERKVERVLKLIGEPGRNVFKSFDLKGDEAKSVERVLSRFEAFFGGGESLAKKRHGFFSRSQRQGEPVEEFAADVFDRCRACDFGDLGDSLARSAIASGLLPSYAHLKDRLIQETDPGIEKTFLLCRQAGPPRTHEFNEEDSMVVLLPRKRKPRNARDIPPTEKVGKYLSEWVKSPRKIIIGICGAVVIVCVLFLIIFFSMNKGDDQPEGELSMSPRVKRRADWNALEPKSSKQLQVNPPKYVIICHTAGSNCTTPSTCATIVNNIQAGHIALGWSDIGYNFLVGGDGYVYEGRGWGKEGAHTFGFNSYSIGLAFIGNFMKISPSKRQIEAAFLVLKEGVHLGKLDPNYKILYHQEVKVTQSPGSTLIKLITEWPHWSPCDDECKQIKNSTSTP